MQVNPKTGTESKFVMNAMFLFWKLTEIQKHLRDCSEDIVKFANFLAERLDFVEKPVMCPWDFVTEWKDAVQERHYKLSCEFGGIDEYRDPAGMRENIKAQVSLDQIDKMMPIFAEDLCGKEFAEVAELCKENGVGKTKLRIRESAEKSVNTCTSSGLPDFRRFGEKERREMFLKIALGRNLIYKCHPFPPGDPVLVEEGKRAIKNGSLSEVERIPPPLGHEFGPHGEYC